MSAPLLPNVPLVSVYLEMVVLAAKCAPGNWKKIATQREFVTCTKDSIVTKTLTLAKVFLLGQIYKVHRRIDELSDAVSVTAFHVTNFAARPGRPCNVQGKWHENGALFRPSCRAVCSCIDGDLGCVPTCTTPLSSPASLDCSHPR